MSVLQRCLSYREANKGSKERQGPTLGVWCLYLRAIFQVEAPGGLIFGGAYFRNFTVLVEQCCFTYTSAKVAIVAYC